VFSDIPPGYEGRGHGSDFVGKPENRASINTALRYRSQAQMELKRAIAMLDAYRKSRREAEKERAENLPAKPANENCTNDLLSCESNAPSTSPTPPPTSRGEPERERFPLVNQKEERPASGLSKDPSPQNFTNELTPPPQTQIVRRRGPLPSHLRGPVRW
ncbi:MAG: hypothetical protein AAFY56_14285, partial [Pseudomonadota bacterium]